MASARKIEGFDSPISFREAAARAVEARTDELFGHADGVLDTGDIERVHDMRVASRRLRAALEVFEPCFPRRELRRALRDVKALADALGARRDPDVQLAALAGIEEAMGPHAAPGLEVFGERVRAEQAHGNEMLAAALRRAEDHDLRGRLEALAGEAP